MPTETFKEMGYEKATEILKLINEWWKEENMEPDMLRARVILIFKKGNTNRFENYRPISLLNTLYKIFATITQIRIANQVDKHLQKNQYGFRTVSYKQLTLPTNPTV